MLEYETMIDINIVEDEEKEEESPEKIKYVDIMSPTSGNRNFINALCMKK